MATQLEQSDVYEATYNSDSIGKLQSVIFSSRLDKIKEYMAKTRSPKIALDIGCGPMFASQPIKQFHKKTTYIGLDISPGIPLKKYRDVNRAKLQQNNIEAIRASANALPIKEKGIGMITSLDVLEHIPNPQKAISEIKRVAAPKGLVVISLPLENFMQKILRLGFIPLKFLNDPTIKDYSYKEVLSWIAKTPPYHYADNVKNYASMLRMLERNFKIIKICYTPMGLSKQFNVNAVIFLADQ